MALAVRAGFAALPGYPSGPAGATLTSCQRHHKLRAEHA